MKTKVLLFVVILALGVLGWKIYQAYATTDDSAPTYYGNIDTRTVTLGFRFLGEIKSVLTDEGMSVKRGEKLAELLNAPMRYSLQEVEANIDLAKADLQKLRSGFRVEEVQEAKAQLAEAKAALARAEDSYKRSEQLIRTKSTSEERFIQNKWAYKQALAQMQKARAAYTLKQNGYRPEDIRAQEARVAALRAKAEQLKVDLNDTTIYAPVDGVILSRFKEPGAIATPGESVFEIAREDEFWVRAYVDEPLLGSVRPGQKMMIYTDSRAEPYKGHVGFIAPNAEFTPKNIQTEELRADLVYRFRVIIEHPDDAIRQGMPVTLKAAVE